MSYSLPQLVTKEEIDYVIRNVSDLLVVLRFGRDGDVGCLQIDDVVCGLCCLVVVVKFVLLVSESKA